MIAIRLAATGGVLFQVRYFSPREGTGREDVRVTSATLRPAIAIVLGAPVFGSLLAIPHGGDGTAAAALLVGVSVSILPFRSCCGSCRRSGATCGPTNKGRYVLVTVVGVIVYVVLVAAAITLVDL